MSAASGIKASQKLAEEYAAAVEGNNVRFLKVSIQKESLVSDGSWPPSGKLADDLSRLSTILTDKDPAYILAKLDGVSEWLFISYVPDIANVRDKMLYASSRNALTKALGGDRITDTIFATSKADVTPEAYAAHLRHLAAPKPMSAREKELESVRAAERQSAEAYEGSNARRSHVGTRVGFKWHPEAEQALKDLGAGGGKNLVVLSLDSETETLALVKSDNVTTSTLSGALPTDQPSYSFYMWLPGKLVFVYACPSSSKVKVRMQYSSGVNSTVLEGQGFVGTKVIKRLETSDPDDLDPSYFTETPDSGSGTHTPDNYRSAAFNRPRGPVRRPQ